MAKSDAVFTKEQLIKSDTFSEYRDVLAVVLKDDRTYTKEQVRKAIEKFFKN
jgi:hypothetical protein